MTSANALTNDGRGGGVTPFPQPFPTPFTGHSDAVRSEWIDENGHMNMAYYVVVFDGAIDHIWPALGLGEAYRRSTRHGTFAAEAHILYRTELLLGDRVHVDTQIVGADAKRIHLAHEMRRESDGAVVAQQEVMLLHVSLESRRVVPFPPAVAALVAAGARAHAVLARPQWLSRQIAIPVPMPA